MPTSVFVLEKERESETKERGGVCERERECETKERGGVRVCVRERRKEPPE